MTRICILFAARLPMLRALLLSAVAVLSACGSQMDAIEIPDVRPLNPAPAGIYSGSFSPASGVPVQVTALVNADRIFIFDADGALIASGRYDVGTRSLTWRARAFMRRVVTAAADPDELEDEDEAPDTERIVIVTGALVAEGEFTPEAGIQMGYTLSTLGDENGDAVVDAGTLVLTYARTAYERRSDLPLLAHTWVNEDSFGAAIASFPISQDGSLFGQDVDGCTYSGQLSLINQPYNLYGVSLQVQCAGSATPRIEAGLATLQRQSLGGADTLMIVTTGPETATLLRLNRNN